MDASRSVFAVGELFTGLENLQRITKSLPQPDIAESCTTVVRNAEKVVECLHYRTLQYTNARNDSDVIMGHLRDSIQNLISVKKERLKLEDLNRLSHEMKLVDAGVDPRPFELPPQLQSQSTEKHNISFGDLKQQKLQSTGGSSRSGTSSPQSGFGIRKARSDPDINMFNLQKEIDSLKIDTTRLRDSEKKLLKDNLQLGRKCKLVTEERDRADDRLKIEQTQRDSIEKLRQRNRELEEQVMLLKQKKVIKEKEGKDEE